MQHDQDYYVCWSILNFDEDIHLLTENDDGYAGHPLAITASSKPPIGAGKILGHPAVMGNLDADYVGRTSSYQPSTDLDIKDSKTNDGEAAHNSVVIMAHQLVARKLLSSSSADVSWPRPKNFDPSRRRGSKSLPATPLPSPQGSPTSRRRFANRYFTEPFVSDESQSGWFLSRLLSKRDVSQSTELIPGEQGVGEMGRSVSDLHIDQPKLRKKEARAKSSEFRELNFWSPTSM